MKYLLLLILTLLPNALIRGFAPSPCRTEFTCISVTEPDGQDTIKFLDSIKDDTIRAALNNAFVVAPKDTFPLQVGAFRFKSNADRILRGMQSLSGLKVKIYVENIMKERPDAVIKQIKVHSEKHGFCYFLLFITNKTNLNSEQYKSELKTNGHPFMCKNGGK